MRPDVEVNGKIVERQYWTSFIIRPTDPLISQIYFCQEILHVSGSSSAHHQEFSTVHSVLVYIMQIWWHIPVSNVQWKTPDDRQRNCLKHAEFLDKNKFGKLVHLLDLLKRNYTLSQPMSIYIRSLEQDYCVVFLTIIIITTKTTCFTFWQGHHLWIIELRFRYE